MARLKKLGWALGSLLPLAGSALLLVFGGFFLLAAVGPELASGRSVAWLSALLVLAWFAAHLRTRVHGRRRAPLERDAKAELAFALRRGGLFHRRDGLRRQGSAGYSGRSHSGERPRYD